MLDPSRESEEMQSVSLSETEEKDEGCSYFLDFHFLCWERPFVVLPALWSASLFCMIESESDTLDDDSVSKCDKATTTWSSCPATFSTLPPLMPLFGAGL